MEMPCCARWRGSREEVSFFFYFCFSFLWCSSPLSSSLSSASLSLFRSITENVRIRRGRRHTPRASDSLSSELFRATLLLQLLLLPARDRRPREQHLLRQQLLSPLLPLRPFHRPCFDPGERHGPSAPRSRGRRRTGPQRRPRGAGPRRRPWEGPPACEGQSRSRTRRTPTRSQRRRAWRGCEAPGAQRRRFLKRSLPWRRRGRSRGLESFCLDFWERK